MKKYLLVLISLFILLIGGGAVWLFQYDGIQKSINHFLPSGYSLTIKSQPHFSRQGISIDEAHLSYQSCTLAKFNGTQIDFTQREINVDQLKLDPNCVEINTTDVNQSEQDQTNSPTLTWLNQLIAKIPEGKIQVSHLSMTAPKRLPFAKLQDLFDSDMQLILTNHQQQLTFYLETASSEVIQAKLQLQLEKEQVRLQMNYISESQQQHELSGDIHLDENLVNIPKEIVLNYQWNVENTLLPNGKILLQGNQENFRLQLLEYQDDEWQERILLPVRFSKGVLSIEQAQVKWAKYLPQPLNAFLNLQLGSETQPTQQGFPLPINFRLSLLTEGNKGKGLVVLQGTEGIITTDKIQLPLQMNGEIKVDDTIFYSRLPMQLSGGLEDWTLRFLSGALLRMQGKTPYINLKELRLPLAGIMIDQYGINGRLNAILRGDTPQLSDIDLHLAGQANQFIAGLVSVFNIQNTDLLITDEANLANHWQWRLWGNANSRSLGTRLKISGQGNWHNDNIRVQQLNANLDPFKLGGTNLKRSYFELTQPIEWQYKAQMIQGGGTLYNQEVRFDYGGRLHQPKINLDFNGKDLKNINFKGSISAGGLGPVNLFASYRNQTLRGNLYWLKQATTVFQSLFPEHWKWLLQKGSIIGQTSFSAHADTGLIAGGHFNLQQVDIALPNGKIEGINFAIPYRYQQQSILLGANQPLTVSIERIDYNNILFENLAVKVQGHYPWHRRSPLRLEALSLNLFDGELSVNQFLLPQTKPAYLVLKDIDLARVIEALHYEQAQLTGKLKAKFPFWIENSSCIICHGIIEQQNQWRVKLSEKLVEQLRRKGGMTENILLNLLATLYIDDSSMTIDLSQQGEMRLDAKLKAHNDTENKINLNYNHKENFFDLWRSIAFGSKLKQNLEYKVSEKQESLNE